MILILIALGALVATLLGGLFAIKWSDKLHLILGFSAGAIIGVAFFDLLPEAVSIGQQYYSVETIILWIVLGFVAYLILDRAIFMHNHGEQCEHDGHKHKGRFGAGSLSFHSFLDGVAIGIGFHASNAAGVVVAAAVLAHDFSDGINTVSIILKNGGSKKEAFRWLVVDALAPVAGILSTFIFAIPESATGIILAVFCGFFLYIGASDLLPESHHGHPTRWTTLSTVLGMAVIYLAVHFVA